MSLSRSIGMEFVHNALQNMFEITFAIYFIDLIKVRNVIYQMWTKKTKKERAKFSN